MIETNSSFIVCIKRISKELKAFIVLLILLCIALSALYFMYYISVKSDDYIIEFTGKYLTPLAQFLNPSEKTYLIYKNTSIYVLLFIIPLGGLIFVIDLIESAIFNLHKKIIELKEKIQTAKEYNKSLKEFCDISDYSICISLECNNEHRFENQYKNILVSQFKKIMPKLNINLDKTIIITSNNFNEYDNIFDTVLKTLASFKKQVLKKQNIKIIYSITSDAHIINSLDLNEIQDNHFKILNFNFKNRASNSAIFYKKYSFLDLNKYKGIPVGLFNSTKKEETKTFELNIVYKNLDKTLNNF